MYAEMGSYSQSRVALHELGPLLLLLTDEFEVYRPMRSRMAQRGLSRWDWSRVAGQRGQGSRA